MRTDRDKAARNRQNNTSQAVRFLTECGSKMTPEERADEVKRLAPELTKLGCKVAS